jgi:hypothetical protein
VGVFLFGATAAAIADRWLQQIIAMVSPHGRSSSRWRSHYCGIGGTFGTRASACMVHGASTALPSHKVFFPGPHPWAAIHGTRCLTFAASHNWRFALDSSWTAVASGMGEQRQ